MKRTQLGFIEPRSSKKNLMDRVLLASWIALYSVMLLGFGILKRTEDATKQDKLPSGSDSKSS
jgi:hypothetical protein